MSEVKIYDVRQEPLPDTKSKKNVSWTQGVITSIKRVTRKGVNYWRLEATSNGQVYKGLHLKVAEHPIKPAENTSCWFIPPQKKKKDILDVTLTKPVTTEDSEGRKGVVPLAVHVPKGKGNPDYDGDSFHNPYAFVQAVPRNDNDPVWGRFEPPGHDMWYQDKLTGRIEVLLAAKTPYFSAKAKPGRDEDDRVYETLDYIPATTLKGAWRSMYEALTNSCFSMFQPEKKVSHRIETDNPIGPSPKDLVPVMIEQTDNGWIARKMQKVRVLTYAGDPDPDIHSPGYPRPRIDLSEFKDREKVCFKYKPVPVKVVKITHQDNVTKALEKKNNYEYQAIWNRKPSRKELQKTLKLNMDAEDALKNGKLHRGVITGDGIKDYATGEVYRFRVHVKDRESNESVRQPAKAANWTTDTECWFDVTTFHVVEDVKHYSDPCPDGYHIGYLRKDGKTIERKYYEEIFYPYKKGDGHILELPESRIEEFEMLIQDSRRLARHLKGKELSPYLQGDPADFHVEDGMLLYAEVESGKVKKLYRTTMGRALYDTDFGQALDRVSPTLRPCESMDKLCPACRLFGWTAPRWVKSDKDSPSGYKGRLRIGKASMLSGPGVKKLALVLDNGQHGLPLDVLSSPKPNKAVFYLTEKGDEKPKWDNKGSFLAGRKFYWNQADVITDWKSKATGSHPGPFKAPFRREGDKVDTQNMVIKNWVEPGTVFKTTIEFENLAPEELGALLAILEMPQGAALRIGGAKPLGFGSFDSRVSKMEILDVKGSYQDMGPLKWQQPGMEQVKKYVQSFAQSLWEAYKEHAEKQEPALDNLPFVADLFRVLTGPDPLDKVIYPRVKRYESDPGPQIAWSKKHKDDQLPRPRSGRGLNMEESNG